MIKVTIDREECTACEVCWSVCPQVFQQNDDDTWSEVTEQHRADGKPGEGEVSDELGDCVREAAEGCPVEIIHVS